MYIYILLIERKKTFSVRSFNYELFYLGCRTPWNLLIIEPKFFFIKSEHLEQIVIFFYYLPKQGKSSVYQTSLLPFCPFAFFDLFPFFSFSPFPFFPYSLFPPFPFLLFPFSLFSLFPFSPLFPISPFLIFSFFPNSLPLIPFCPFVPFPPFVPLSSLSGLFSLSCNELRGTDRVSQSVNILFLEIHLCKGLHLKMHFFMSAFIISCRWWTYLCLNRMAL